MDRLSRPQARARSLGHGEPCHARGRRALFVKPYRLSLVLYLDAPLADASAALVLAAAYAPAVAVLLAILFRLPRPRPCIRFRPCLARIHAGIRPIGLGMASRPGSIHIVRAII